MRNGITVLLYFCLQFDQCSNLFLIEITDFGLTPEFEVLILEIHESTNCVFNPWLRVVFVHIHY